MSEQLTKYCHYCSQEQCVCAQGTTSSGTANPTPQPHADDVKLAEAITFKLTHQLATTPLPGEIAKNVSEVTTPLRLTNEALRERVKPLEGVLMVQNDKVCIHHNDAERLKIFDGCPICKLTAASEVIEKCEKYIDNLFLEGVPTME